MKTKNDTSRPPLTKDLKSEDFKEYYFLKEELKDFCRNEGLKISGSKNQLEERIIYYLDTGKSLDDTKNNFNNKSNPNSNTNTNPNTNPNSNPNSNTNTNTNTNPNPNPNSNPNPNPNPNPNSNPNSNPKNDLKNNSKSKSKSNFNSNNFNSNNEIITLDSILGENFKCSEDKREFFKKEIGKGFKFKVNFQKWLKANPDKTYQDAINAYHNLQNSNEKTKIGKQFQYNQYIRDFFNDNEDKTLNDAIKCWNYKKSQKGHNKYEKSDLKILSNDDKMSLEKKNSKEIEEYLKSKGAEVVGFASLEGIKNVPKEYPNSILIGIPIEKEALKTIYTDDQSLYVESMKNVANKLNEIILDGESYIQNEMNYNALAISRERVMGELKDLASKIPHKTTGTRSGIGWIGRCALLISPKYGAALRLSTLLTDMPIKTGSPIDDSLCDDCTDCQDACPVDAINEVKWNSRREREEYFDANKCFEFIKKEMERTNGKSLCAKCGLACPYTKEYLGIKTDRDLIKEI